MFQGVLAHYVFRVEPSFGGGPRLIFTVAEGGPGFLDEP